VMKGGEGEDVPGVSRNNVCGDEIDLVRGVRAAAVADRANVGVQPLLAGAFHLYSEEASIVFDGDVVGSTISPGLGDAEAEFAGAGHEAQFGPLSARLGVADVRPLISH
jgi:hypothetical protein